MSSRYRSAGVQGSSPTCRRPAGGPQCAGEVPTLATLVGGGHRVFNGCLRPVSTDVGLCHWYAACFHTAWSYLSGRTTRTGTWAQMGGSKTVKCPLVRRLDATSMAVVPLGHLRLHVPVGGVANRPSSDRAPLR